MIDIKVNGSFKNTENFLHLMKAGEVYRLLDDYGRQGVEALSRATPVDTSETAHSWYYEVVRHHGQYSLVFHNSHMAGGVPVVILLQYGHATRSGSFVQGRDFINPAIRPIFDRIATDVWKAVIKA